MADRYQHHTAGYPHVQSHVQWTGPGQQGSQYPPSTGHYSTYSASSPSSRIHSSPTPHLSSPYTPPSSQSIATSFQGAYYTVASPFSTSPTLSQQSESPISPSVSPVQAPRQSHNHNHSYSHPQSHPYSPSHSHSHSRPRAHSHVHPYSPPQTSGHSPVISHHHSPTSYQAPHSYPQPISIPGQFPASPNRPFSCDMCALSFNRQHDLKRHRETHTGEKPFLCNGGCGKTFTRKDALKRHQLVKGCGKIEEAWP